MIDLVGIKGKNIFNKYQDVQNIYKYNPQKPICQGKNIFKGQWYIGKNYQKQIIIKKKKKLQKKTITKERSERQIKMHQLLLPSNHPNLIQCYEIVEKQNFYHIILQYCNRGDLSQYLKTKQLNEKQIIQFAIQIVEPLKNIHALGYFHRDIKPQNILVHQENNKLILKLADFGTVRQIKMLQQYIYTNTGTYDYMPPNMILSPQSPAYSYKCDIWSFGCTIYQIIFKKKLFIASEQYQKSMKVLANNFKSEGLKLEKNLNRKLEYLLKSTLVYEEKNRIQFQAIFDFLNVSKQTQLDTIFDFNFGINIGLSSKIDNKVFNYLQYIKIKINKGQHYLLPIHFFQKKQYILDLQINQFVQLTICILSYKILNQYLKTMEPDFQIKIHDLDTVSLTYLNQEIMKIRLQYINNAIQNNKKRIDKMMIRIKQKQEQLKKSSQLSDFINKCQEKQNNLMNFYRRVCNETNKQKVKKSQSVPLKKFYLKMIKLYKLHDKIPINQTSKIQELSKYQHYYNQLTQSNLNVNIGFSNFTYIKPNTILQKFEQILKKYI